MAMHTGESIQLLCQTLGVSRAGFYAHRHKAQRPRRVQDRRLAEKIGPIFQQSRRTYGSPRIQIALGRAGERCGKNRVARLMRQQGLRARQKRRFRPLTTQSQHRLPVAENWLAKVPAPARPNQIWVGDITYLPTREGWLYLAIILDACSRKVVGWQTGDSLESSLVTAALKQAWQRRTPAPGLLHHSDRGVQYASGAQRALLATYHITASMSRKGNCYDNAMAESFFATLKTEAFASVIQPTKTETKRQLFEYIEAFYNTRRFHSALDYKSPVEFENQFT
ncbi:MAG TPA: IS3 family transposase [Candidatus Acidoferrum sp.]|nr:IS3 family transposase [Candidatus Acidoferrum sp.]